MIAARIGISLLWLFVGLLFVRMVMSWVTVFARGYRPTGLVAGLFEIVFTVTDPPLRALRRVIPPLRMGNVAFDVAFLVLYVAAIAVISILTPYAS